MCTLVQSLHPYIPICGQSLQFSCRAAEGVTEECTLRVLLLTLRSEVIVIAKRKEKLIRTFGMSE